MHGQEDDANAGHGEQHQPIPSERPAKAMQEDANSDQQRHDQKMERHRRAQGLSLRQLNNRQCVQALHKGGAGWQWHQISAVN
mmetsp:Transcript_34610/g.61432  ORF Transcript_34610/g.61432 Transcript_34610/m.61432 type:complete len:83 (-) Transcript_34610:150-398(-)